MKLPWWRGRKGAQEAQRGAAPPIPSTGQVRNLWGRDFALREQGLDEAQVAAFVNELLTRYNALLQEYEQGKSMRGFSRQVTEDADRQATTIRARAKRDGELEAARLLSEAQRQANQTVGQANQRAEEITGQQVREILQAARRQAELIDRQSQIVAQRFLLQVREEVQGQITSEVQSAYYRLLNTVQELLTAGQNVEAEWKSKTYQLMNAAPLELEHYQSRFMDRLVAGGLTTEGERPLGEDAQEFPLPTEPSTAGFDEVLLSEAPPSPPMGERAMGARAMGERERREAPFPIPPGGTPPSPEAAPRVSPSGVLPREERGRPTPATIPHDGTMSPLSRQAGQEETTDTKAPFVPEVVPPSPVREALEEILRNRPYPDASGQAAPADLVIPAAKPSVGRDTPAVAPLGPPVERDRLYQGEVDLVMGPSVDFQRVAKFYGHLQSLRGLQILRTTGDLSEGTIITVVLDTPSQLVVLLESVPNARVLSETRDGKGNTAKGEKRARITVTLADEP